MKSLLLATLVLVCASACYKMPTDEDYCLTPSTNNPDFTREKASNNPMMPNIGY